MGTTEVKADSRKLKAEMEPARPEPKFAVGERVMVVQSAACYEVETVLENGWYALKHNHGHLVTYGTAAEEMLVAAPKG